MLKKINLLKTKAQSEVIGTVLLILIVLIIAIILLNFAVPFVKKQLAGTSCFDIAGQISFSNSPKYTCFNHVASVSADSEDVNEINLQVHIEENKSLSGVMIEYKIGPSSSSKTIKQGTEDENIKMYDAIDFGGPLELPGKNEERTYTIKVAKDLADAENEVSVKIYPIIDSKTCDSSDFIGKLEQCK